MVNIYIIETLEYGKKYINKFCSYRGYKSYIYNKHYKILCCKPNVDKNVYYSHSALQLLKMFS